MVPVRLSDNLLVAHHKEENCQGMGRLKPAVFRLIQKLHGRLGMNPWCAKARRLMDMSPSKISV